MSNETNRKNYWILQILSVIFLIICLAGTVYFVRARFYNTFSSDEASEMVLGNLLASEGKLISKNWYYSTELRVLNTNIFYSLFFHLTGSWHRVRLLTTVSMYLLFLLAFYGMSRVCGFRKYFSLVAAVLFLPFSEIYFHIILKGIHYLPCMTISVLMLTLSELYIRSSGRKGHGLLALSLFFSVIVGLGGARQILVLYIPLLTAAALLVVCRRDEEASRRWFLFAVTAFIGGAVGFVINGKILSGIYHFEIWEDFAFTDLNFQRIAGVLRGFLRSFGYSAGKIFSAVLLRNAVSMAWALFTVYALWYALKRDSRVCGSYLRLAVFMISAVMVFILFYAFTDASYNDRYNLPILVFAFPLAALFIDQSGSRKRIALTAFSVMTVLTAFNGQMYYGGNWNKDPNEELKKISAYLSSQDYQNGYSSFWYANTVTELSNGRIEMWSITDDSNGQAFMRVTDIDQTYHWLQKVSHDTTHPSGKLFILFNAEEAENNTWKDHLKDERIIYRSSDFVIYGYDNYEQMTAELYPGYDFTFGDNQWMENGKDIDGSRELYVGGVSYGPYETFWPGTYTVTVRGQNLDKALAICLAEQGKNQLDIYLIEQSDKKLNYTFVLSEKTHHVETLVRNISDDDTVVIDSMQIRRLRQ